MAFHSFRPRRGLPGVYRRATAARGSPHLPPQPWNPSARRESRRSRGADTAYGLAQAERRDARSRAAPRRCAALLQERVAISRPPVTPGSREQWSRRVRARCRCSSGPGSRVLVEMRIDAQVISAEELRSPPAPDLLVLLVVAWASARDDVVYFTHSAAGVAAGKSAGVAVIGVGDETQGSSCPALARSAPQPL